ncbi:unnamed protein product [Protopolystoma xenopodis]|uniref:Uncharacterized protein n=1 Tax=Protopolystoma xenopodis TaxID=117903 RepID=A0A448WF64_9PLAT|nr:unnamed protein product [Protopolystoma xenopodis]
MPQTIESTRQASVHLLMWTLESSCACSRCLAPRHPRVFCVVGAVRRLLPTSAACWETSQRTKLAVLHSHPPRQFVFLRSPSVRPQGSAGISSSSAGIHRRQVLLRVIHSFCSPSSFRKSLFITIILSHHYLLSVRLALPSVFLCFSPAGQHVNQPVDNLANCSLTSESKATSRKRRNCFLLLQTRFVVSSRLVSSILGVSCCSIGEPEINLYPDIVEW